MLIFIAVIGFQVVNAQNVIPTKGKNFWVGFLENYETETNESLDLFITSNVSTTGVVELPTGGWSENFTVTANQTTTVTIPNNVAEHYINQIIEDKGVYVETADTVSVFAINFNGYTADGTKILPVQSLGTQYRISSYIGLLSYNSEFVIVATEDDTEVEITPSAATANGDAAGVPFTVALNRGQSYMVQAGSAAGDFTGTVIQGTEASGDCRPFAVFSGSSCTNIPDGCTACDHIFEENFPVNSWGTDFFVVPFEFATSYTYRVLADEDNTSVQIDGGAPFILNAGEFEEYNYVNDVQCVTADKPISVTQYMQGINCSGEGDPAMLIMNDVTQKIDNITFSTVNSTVITQHGLNIIMESSDIASLTLDGVEVDVSEFTAFPSCPDHSYAQITITEGSHTLDSPNGFTAYVYGTGSAESYAYSVGSFSSLPPIIVDEVLCTSETVTLVSESGLMDVYWYAESDPETILGEGPTLEIFPPIVSDIYVSVGSQFLSGCVEEEYFSVESPDPIALTMFQSETEVCQFQSVQLDVAVDPESSIYEYTWTPATGLSDPFIANPIATPLESTWYHVLVSSPTGCTSNVDSVYIEVIPGALTNFDITALGNTIFCTGDEVELEADIEASVLQELFNPAEDGTLWADIQNGTASEGCGSSGGNAMYFDGNGERSLSTIDLDVTNGGTVTFDLVVGNSVWPCDNADPGEDIILEYSTTGAGGPWVEIETYLESGYPSFTTISVEIPAGAETANTRFKWSQVIHSGDGQDNWALDNIYVGENSTVEFELLWTPDYNITDVEISNPIVDPLLDTTYYLDVVDNDTGCEYTDSIFVDVGQSFVLDLPNDTALCDVQGLELYAIPDIEDQGYTYEWSPNDGTINNVFSDTPTVTPVSTTTYDVVVTSEHGCTAEADVTITVNGLLDLEAFITDDEICAGDNTELSANLIGSVDVDYEWSPTLGLDDPNIFNPIATPSDDVEYIVTATDNETGCILTESVEVTVFVAYSVDAGADQDLCEVAGFQLNALEDSDDFITWLWEPASAVSDPFISNPTVLDDATQELIVTGSNALGCDVSDTIQLTLLLEDFDLGPDVDVCQGDVVTLTTGYPESFIHDWNTSETTSSIDVTTSDIYSVTVTDDNGCVRQDNMEVVVHELPVVEIGEDPGLCEGEFYALDAGNPGSSFEWSDDAITQVNTVSETGTYSVIVTDVWNCQSTDEVDLVFHANPVLNLPDEISICEDESVTLDAENVGSVYEWSNDQTTQTITTNTPGFYSVTVTNLENCSSSDQTLLNVLTYPVVNIGADQSLCTGEQFILDAGNPLLNHEWNTSETTQTITVNQTGVYSVTVDNGYCFTSDDVSIVFNALPVDNLIPDSATCFSEPPYFVTLDAGNTGSLYEWSTGSTSQVINANQEGLYSVEVTTEFGCTSSFDVWIIEVCFGEHLYVPNAFTPDNDGLNDVHQAKGDGVTDYHIDIWNRWGEQVWSSDDITIPWDGSYRDGDYYVENEVYHYRVRYKYVMDDIGTISDWVEQAGFVTIIR